MAKRFDAPFELQRLHGMGSGVYRELFACAPSPRRTPSVRRSARMKTFVVYLRAACWRTAPIPSFVHQLANDAGTLPRSCWRRHCMSPAARLSPPRDILAPRRNSDGVDLTVATMRAPPFAAFATTQINPPADATSEQEAPPCSAPTRPLRLATAP